MTEVTRREILKIGLAGSGAIVATGLGFDMAVAESSKVTFSTRRPSFLSNGPKLSFKANTPIEPVMVDGCATILFALQAM